MAQTCSVGATYTLAFGQQPGETLPAPYRSPDVPAPVLLRKGTDPADWTPEQQYKNFVHNLGGKFATGVPKPPGGDVIYQPSPNDVVEFRDGQWVEKNPYREIP